MSDQSPAAGTAATLRPGANDPKCEHLRATLTPTTFRCDHCGDDLPRPDTHSGPRPLKITYDEGEPPACTYYQGCIEPRKSCGYCATHCLCGVSS